MGKLIAWVAGFTKVGKIVKQTQTALDGKKQYIAGFLSALPATLSILMKFVEAPDPIQFLMGLTSTPEFAAAGLGWATIFNAAKGEKIRTENAEIMAALKPALTSSVEPQLPS